MDIINLKIDVTKITKSRLYKGEKGTYLNCALVPTPNSEHSDYMIVEDITKDERAQGMKGVAIGNGKVFKRKETPPATAKTTDKVDSEGITPNDQLPF